ncbi:mitotic interactor and substrate of PLK1 [Tamandua tetradactyla]|uniref:mitotic interactor and substrate of PLK1 n=1 Tax=Tamandua tetradactyla TaxID=48850 RepID=UPI0040539FF8
MDRVTRYPILGIAHWPRATGLALDGDTSYSFEVVDVGPEAGAWVQTELQAWPEARLDTERPRASPHLRASSSQPTPWRFRSEEEEKVKGDRLDTEHAFPGRPRDLEQERWAVIQGQAVRRGDTVATLRGTPSPSDGAPRQPSSASLEESAVDTGQIDFLAARQQFLSLEQAHAGIPGCTPPAASQAPRASNKPHLAKGSVGPVQCEEKEVARHEQKGRVPPAGPFVPTGDHPASRAQAGSPEPTQETPIEREIRRAQEREAALREQRGLQRAAGCPELVAVPSRPLLTVESPGPAPRRERGRPSLYVQRDLAQETQREQDHRQEGLRLRRASSTHAVSGDPEPGLRRTSSSDTVLRPDARATSPPPGPRKVSRIPPDAYLPYLGAGASRLEFPAYGASCGPSAAGSAGSQRHRSESSGKAPEAQQEHRQPLRAKAGVVRQEYFFLRPLRFRVPDVPREAEAPQVWGQEVAGPQLWRLQKTPSSELLAREVESALRREREMAEERRSIFFPEVFSPHPEESCDQDSRSSSRASGITGSYSVSESPSFTPIHLHSDLVWTVATEPESPGTPPGNGPQQRKKKDLQYAGLSPSDHINSEILEATRVTRHKSALAERWEAGLYTSEDED